MIARRSLLQLPLALTLLPLDANATPESMARAMADAYGTRTLNPGRVDLKVPALAENGQSVSLKVQVDSPMLDNDYVRRIDLFSERNPLPVIARFECSPLCGVAQVHTRIRLADSQTISAVAEMSDGSLWLASAKTIVTLAACTDFLI